MIITYKGDKRKPMLLKKKFKSTLLVTLVCFFFLICYHSFLQSEKESLKKKLSHLSHEELLELWEAGKEVLRLNQQLAEVGSTVVKEIVKGKMECMEKVHYPKQAIIDKNTFSQYYFHSHREKENGHFHLFLRKGGIDSGATPIVYDKKNHVMNGPGTFAHLIAISMDEKGKPTKLFTTNQWVTGEDWYSSSDLCKMVKRFDMSGDSSHLIVDRLVSSMFKLFSPQIIELILKKEEILQRKRDSIPLVEILEDQTFEVISEIKISIELQMKVVEELMIYSNSEALTLQNFKASEYNCLLRESKDCKH